MREEFKNKVSAVKDKLQSNRNKVGSDQEIVNSLIRELDNLENIISTLDENTLYNYINNFEVTETSVNSVIELGESSILTLYDALSHINPANLAYNPYIYDAIRGYEDEHERTINTSFSYMVHNITNCNSNMKDDLSFNLQDNLKKSNNDFDSLIEFNFKPCAFNQVTGDFLEIILSE